MNFKSCKPVLFDLGNRRALNVAQQITNIAEFASPDLHDLTDVSMRPHKIADFRRLLLQLADDLRGSGILIVHLAELRIQSVWDNTQQALATNENCETQ